MCMWRVCVCVSLSVCDVYVYEWVGVHLDGWVMIREHLAK